MNIKTPNDLRAAISIAVSATTETNPTYFDIIWGIHKYKWYNWYQNIHIKKDSPEDIENTLIFEEIKNKYPQIHFDIEKNIDFEIEKLKTDL